MNSSLLALLRISGLTVVGAFLGTMSSVTTMPTTLLEWKAAVMPALWAAFVAERVLVQSTVTADLAAAVAPAAPAAMAVKK
jgi:hypothetical protein